ncbi:sigma-70 family RNA polymerase sigma factor [Luteitalea sp.]|uniref:sigma-70 family RNA polymerase sigma factor n=1 Tax=Luteitalea sp. TaxID=2004800 RepID=UPI0025B83C08|nr:sigma-70 family RNA polymerase sigma factor [Luteitalea sp.]
MKPVTLDWSSVSDAEAALVSRCLAGDEQACTELVESHQRMVYQLAFHLLGDKEEALDLSQDVFLTVFRMLDRFRGQSALRTWIYRIVVNQARNRQRWWRRRYQSAQVPLDVHVSEHGELSSPRDDCGPERLLRQKEQADRVWQALRDLPFDQRTALVLREIDGLSYEEIGYSLNVAVGTVKSRLARARQLLRAELQP